MSKSSPCGVSTTPLLPSPGYLLSRCPDLSRHLLTTEDSGENGGTNNIHVIDEGVAVVEIPTTQHAIQITGKDEILHNKSKQVDPVRPTPLPLQVEACGICASASMLLRSLVSPPRKAEVVAGMALAALPDIPGYKPGSQPTVPGHEPV